MKKSKFLKKSLAMLLAVMLVVAMIPLSASASAPNLQQVRATADGETVLLTESGNTFTGTYRRGASTVDLQVVVARDNQVYYTDISTTASTDRLATPNNNNNNLWSIANLDVKRYTNADGNVEVDFSVADRNDPKVRENYSVVLTPVTADTTAEITDFELNRVMPNNEIPNWEKASIGVDFVSVTMPYDSVNSGVTYQIRNMSVSEGATWTITRGTNTVATGNDTGIVNGVNMANNVTVTVQNGDVITVTNAGNTRPYTLHIDIADGFETFETAEGLDAVLFPKSGNIVVLLPFGTAADANGGDITVTPLFTLDYPSATATWNGHEIDGVDDTITIDADDVVDSQSSMTTFDTFEGTNNDDWTGRKEIADDSFANFVKGTYLENNANRVVAATINLTYADEATRPYNVYFMETRLNNETEIDRLVIGSEDAVIDQDAKTIDITLPNGTNLASVNLRSNNRETAAAFTGSFGANISFVVPAATFETNTGVARSVTDTFTTERSNTRLDLRQPVTVSVKSEDSINEEFYTLNVNASSEYADAEITSFTIRNGDYTYTAQPDKNGNVTLVVPYEIYNRTQLNGWNFFYTKTIGTLATCNNRTLPVSGSAITAADAYIPARIGDGTEGAAIAVSMTGDDLTVNTKEYRIKIDRAAAKTESSLEKFTLVGRSDWEVPGAPHTYQGTINKTEETITANVSWTAGQYWAGGASAGMNAIIEAAADSNARIFFENRLGNLIEFVDSGSANPTPVDRTNIASGTDNNTLYNGAEIYVLSEEMWVQFEQTGEQTGNLVIQNDNLGVNGSSRNYITAANWTANANSSNASQYTIYELTLGANPAEEGAGLTDMTLVDGTGWEADLTINIDQGTLRCDNVPYALTSDLRANGSLIVDGDNTSVNPIFLTYDFKDANRAYVLGRDVTGNPNNNPPSANTPTTIPTAGNNGNAVFTDMADFTGGWTEDKYEQYVLDGNPFLLISREGDVYVYNWVDRNGDGAIQWSEFTRNTAVQTSQLAVCDENGDAYQELKFVLDVDEPNAGTTLSKFWFTGFENAATTITNDTITVTLPYGTDLDETEYTYLIPNFEFTSDSEGAIVTVDDPELLGKPLRSGVTNVNFTSTRKITVIAENETATRQYTVNVQVADAFSDVTAKDWFYNDVMAAAGFGYVNGMGNGKYEPYGTTTRAQFAKILAEALDYDPTAYTTSAFPDVANDHWAMAAIAFCADQEIILGYKETGNFEPSKTITRQEAALMLQRAFDLQGTESNLYPDDAKIAGWAEDGVYAVKHAGLMKGDADTGNFRPTSTMNRAEMATILMNAHRAGLIK